MENEDDGPVGCLPMRDPHAELRAAALASVLITADDSLDEIAIYFAHRIIERCACLAEQYSDANHSAADAIRAELGEH